jgi:hypothetical protein
LLFEVNNQTHFAKDVTSENGVVTAWRMEKLSRHGVNIAGLEEFWKDKAIQGDL